MPKVDITITISVIIALCAILSPIITTIINNRYHLKEKMIDADITRKKELAFYERGVYEDYMRYAGRCIAYASDETMPEYGQAYALALIYFPDDLHDDLVNLDRLISDYHWKEASKAFNDLGSKVRTRLKKL